MPQPNENVLMTRNMRSVKRPGGPSRARAAAISSGAIAATLLVCAPASASTVRFCNATGGDIQIAIGYSDPNVPFTTRGWWTTKAGECSESIPRSKSGNYYVHIKNAAGQPVPFRASRTTASLCAGTSGFADRFAQHKNNGKLDCAAAGLVELKFIKLEMPPDSHDVFRLESDGSFRGSAGGASPLPEDGATPPAAPAAPAAPAPAPAPKTATPSPPPPSAPKVQQPPAAAPTPPAPPAPAPSPAKVTPPPTPPAQAPAPPAQPPSTRSPEACKKYPNLC